MAIGLLVDGTWLDLREGEEKRFFINKTLHDLRDMFGRNSDRSRGIVLPRTPNNINTLVTHAPLLGDNYKALSCQVYMSGVPVLEDANLVITGEDANHYEAQIVGGAATFYNLIPGDSIKLLDYIEDNFEWTLLNYVARANRSSRLVTAWAQWITNKSYSDYLENGGDPVEEMESTDIDKAGFCYYTKDILEQIFNNTSLEIDASQVTNEDYNSLVLVCPMPQIFEANIALDPDRGEVSFIDSYVINIPQLTVIMPFDQVILNQGNVWDPVNFWYEPNTKQEVRLTAFIVREAAILPVSTIRLIKLAGGSNLVVLQEGLWYGDILNKMDFDVIDVGEPGDFYYLDISIQRGNETILPNLTNFQFRPNLTTDRNIEVSEWLPDITQRELVKNVFNLFHIVVSDISGQIVLSLFDKIEEKAQINLNDRIAQDRQIKYSPRLANYAQVNRFKYAEEELVSTNVFNTEIQILDNTLPQLATIIELFFAGMDGSLFGNPGNVVPMFEINYQREDNNNIHIVGTAGNFAEYSTIEANDLEENDVIFAVDSGTPMRFVVRRKFDNKNGELDYQLQINANPPDWSFVHYELKTHKFQLSRVLFDSSAVDNFVFYQGSERLEAGSIFYTDLLNWDYLLGEYYSRYRKMIQNFQVVNIWVDIPNTVFLELNSLRPIYILGNNYYLNKTEQYKENGLVRLELIRFN